MSEKARPRRRYDATRRLEQAALTRARIVESAHQLFVERGYAGATIPQIAADAGVAVETVYRSASGKAGLLAAAVETALAGSAQIAALPVEERPGIRRVIEEPDPARKLALYAATQPGVYRRAGPILRVLDEGAASVPELAELREALLARRLAGMRRFAHGLADAGALRAGLTPARAADIIATICSQANYDYLVSDRRWGAASYQDWLADTLVRTLLE